VKSQDVPATLPPPSCDFIRYRMTLRLHNAPRTDPGIGRRFPPGARSFRVADEPSIYT
jgi:hypothetical protein